MVFMLKIVLRALHGISQRIIGLHDFVEACTIAGVRIVRMIALSKVTKNPVYRFRVGVRADFEDFVIVRERKSFHLDLAFRPAIWSGPVSGDNRP